MRSYDVDISRSAEVGFSAHLNKLSGIQAIESSISKLFPVPA